MTNVLALQVLSADVDTDDAPWSSVSIIGCGDLEVA
ncbi:class III lanthipeptide [Kitasatospora acidiphila]|nr:class III lanthipeptide [Kitasatospora acidiphila]